MAKDINIGGRLHSIATGNVVAGTDEILDDNLGKKQTQINTETYSLVESINNALAELSPDQEEALGVATKANANEAKLGYYVCDTAAATAAKVIANATGYVLSVGGSIKIKMTNNNTADNATLNINSTGAKALYYAGERASSINTWGAGETVEVYYDGTSYYANNVAGGNESGDGVFDVSAKYPTSGVEGGNTYTLEGALAVLNTELSASKKKGGMSIKFIQTSDNKYVQFRYTGTAVTGTPNPFLETDNWQNMETADAVRYTSQEKTELEKERARQNIGASWDGIHTISDYSLDLLLEILSNAVYTTPQYDNVQEVINNIRSTGQSITVVVKEPSISYGENGKVLMHTITSGASIKYTLDGTTPTKNVGNLYEAPFYPNMDCTIKAVAYKDNVVSAVSEFEYDNSVTYIQFDDPVVEAFLVPKVDTNDNGRIQFTEAAALLDFPSTWFAMNTNVVYFNELKFFTGISQIKNSSFSGCINLKSIEIPNSATYIGSSVFKDCCSLKHVIIGDHVETIDTYAFQNCVSLEEITIPASVKVIKGSSFINSGLKTIVIPDTVTTLNENVFRGCPNLKSVIIGNGVTTLKGNTARDCPLLELVDLGNGITSVDSMEFAGSNNLKTVICRATTPPTLGSAALPNVNINIYVPDSSVAAYTSSSWKTSKTTIHSINEL